MSIHGKHKENVFETQIIDYLTQNDWLEGTSFGYDKDLGLYTEDLLGYIKTTQPQAYEKMAKREGSNTDEVLAKHVAKELDKKGSLFFLRKEVKYIGSKFKLCQFKPELANPELQARYDANILRVVRQVYYSKNNQNSIDLVLFLNGIPIATLELKTDFTQTVEDAIAQYKYDRKPKGEVLLEFKKRCLVHFAVSTQEVYMTTKLAGKDTFFLPFNRGSADGGAGNPAIEGKQSTSYLWEDIFDKDTLLNILARFIHLEQKKVENHNGEISTKETLIFPRYHQLDAVRKLLSDTKENGSGKRYLIQHSAGSGKSNSIAWLAHQLSSLHNSKDESIFDSVIVITDRTVLDSQLQENISSFEHKSGVVACISREGTGDSKSSQLAEALEGSSKIIITTIQTFPFVLEAIQKRASLKGRKYAIIADEAHSSQTGAAAKKLKEVLNAEILNEDEEVSSEDVINAALEAKANNDNLSFYAFTATPKPKTLEMFGVLPNPNQKASKDNKPQPFHLYTMRQAIEEGFILDVLKGYTTYKTYYNLEHANPIKDTEVDQKKAKVKIAKWLNIHPHNISQKVQIIIEHFRHKVAHLLDNQAKAMVVTSSRLSAVKYKQASDKYIKDNNLGYLSSLVAFSGKVLDEGVEHTENNLNKELNGQDMRKTFDTNQYQVMIVANKFQTGFDQPKLCAMYIDKKLGGVNCVQTLSRLNRMYAGKDQTFVIDFTNNAEDIRNAFEPYFTDTTIDDVIDPNVIYDIQLKLEANSIFTDSDIEKYAEAYFSPKGTQAQMSSALKPPVDRYKNKYKNILQNIENTKNMLNSATSDNDTRLIGNLEIELKNLNEEKSELDIFKKDMIKFTRIYDFLSQIVDYDDSELEKLSAFIKGLIPNIKTLDTTKDNIDLTDIKLTHYKLHKQKQDDISLIGDKELANTLSDGRTPKDPKKELLSEIISTLNEIFEGEWADEDLVNYARTISDNMLNNKEVVKQIETNTKANAMIGGFKDSMNDAIIESLDTSTSLATQALSNTDIMNSFANVVYNMMLQKLKNTDLMKAT